MFFCLHLRGGRDYLTIIFQDERVWFCTLFIRTAAPRTFTYDILGTSSPCSNGRTRRSGQVVDRPWSESRLTRCVCVCLCCMCLCVWLFVFIVCVFMCLRVIMFTSLCRTCACAYMVQQNVSFILVFEWEKQDCIIFMNYWQSHTFQNYDVCLSFWKSQKQHKQIKYFSHLTFQTPLHLADNAEVALVLIKSGANVRMKNVSLT